MHVKTFLADCLVGTTILLGGYGIGYWQRGLANPVSWEDYQELEHQLDTRLRALDWVEGLLNFDPHTVGFNPEHDYPSFWRRFPSLREHQNQIYRDYYATYPELLQ